jgi:glycyl-tRNA synthetase beta chain
MADFLLEIGLDEIPARMIAVAEAELGRRASELLTRERLLAQDAKVTTYSTPRRLAALVEGVKARQADTEEGLTGPSWKVAFKDGSPTAAAEAFAKKAGVEVSALEKVTTAKGEYVGATVTRKGRTAADILAAEVSKEVLAIYWPKNMYWRAGKPERFVRPVRWVVALLDTEVVPLEIAGIAAGRASRGHRVLHGEAPVIVQSAKSYAEDLRAAHVVASVAERRKIIRKALDAATRTIPGAWWHADDPLLETVVHLTEWPSVILGSFEEEYLNLPEEILVTVMREHQKYFAIESPHSELQVGHAPYMRKLRPNFVAVLNTQVGAEAEAIIRHGNERVLRARFKDALFFWEFDQRTKLQDRVELLKHVTFHKDLGSYYWKTEQNLSVVKALIATLPQNKLGSPHASGRLVDEHSLLIAARLAKADLTTELVKEFTELQGIIGGQYGLAQQFDATVTKPIYEQYRPASIEDAIPSTIEGQLLGLADRIQTITAMFGIGQVPSGSKDPFALRRAGNAIIKILADSELPLSLSDVVKAASPQQPLEKEVESFLRERLQFYLKDYRGFAYDVVNAVLAAGADDVRDAIARAEALTAVRGSEDFAAISIAFKRIKNILRQASEKGFEVGSPKSVPLAPEAQKLLDAAEALAPRVAELRDERAYGEALALIATLRPTVDLFFYKVMVLDPDPKLRGAHLGLIDQVLREFSGIADFSEIVTG